MENLPNVIITTTHKPPFQKQENPSTNEPNLKPQMGTPPCSSSSSSDDHGFFSSQTPMFPSLFPLKDDQSLPDQVLPISVKGDFYNGVPPNLQIVDVKGEKISTLTHGWDSSVKRSPRSKRRIASRKINTNSSSFPTFSWWKPLSCAATYNYYNKGFCSITTSDGKKLKFILQKELKNSDVSALGRIILPKRPSEASLPSLSFKEGIQVAIREMGSKRVWRMRYRYWPNNKSRMYVLENTGDFVKRNALKNGDFIMIYQDENDQLKIFNLGIPFAREQYISCKKAQDPSVPIHDEHRSQVRMRADGFSDKNPSVVGNNSSNMHTKEVDEQSGSDDMVIEKAMISVGIEDYDFSDLERLPGFEDYDFSLFDCPMKDCDFSLFDCPMEDFMDGSVDNNDG